MTWNLGALVACFLGFSVIHSVLAASRVRGAFLERGVSPRSYRLAYNAISGVQLLPLVWLLQAESPVIWRVGGAWRLLLLAVQAIALLGFLYSFLGFDVREFLGLHAPVPSTTTLQVRRAYALCRHPLYFFAGLFFSTWPFMDAGRLVLAVWIWAYSWIGSVFEERRLVEEFGEAYRDYQASHWRLLPLGTWGRARRRPVRGSSV